MPDLGDDDPLSSAVRQRGNLATATQPGQGALDVTPVGTPLMNIRGQAGPATGGQTVYRDITQGGGLVDQAIQARSAFENQRQALIDRLPYANKRQAAGISASLRAMHEDEQSRHREAMERRITAHESATEMDRQLKADRDTEIDEQGAHMMLAMQHLDGALRSGQITKDEYNQGLIEAGGQFPLGMRHPEAARHYEFAITEADKHDQFVSRQREREAGRIAGKYGVDVQTDPETGMPSIEATRQAALQTDKGKQEVITGLNKEMVQKYGVPTGVASLFNPLVPHSSPDKGKSIELPYLNKKGEVAKLPIPMPLFDQMKTDFQDRYFEVNPQIATPAEQPSVPDQTSAAADPRIELAQRALNDPNASEAHKSAAKQILGIQ